MTKKGQAISIKTVNIDNTRSLNKTNSSDLLSQISNNNSSNGDISNSGKKK